MKNPRRLGPATSAQPRLPSRVTMVRHARPWSASHDLGSPWSTSLDLDPSRTTLVRLARPPGVRAPSILPPTSGSFASYGLRACGLRPPCPPPRTASEHAASDHRVLCLVRPPRVRSSTSGFLAPHGLQDKSVRDARAPESVLDSLLSQRRQGSGVLPLTKDDARGWLQGSATSSPKPRELGHLSSNATGVGHVTTEATRA